jgi:acyl-coenzyme A thioesterase PaaI-like protein
MIASSSLSIQESLYPALTCFGCGQANPHGFQVRSYQMQGLTVAEFNPRPEHDNGFGFLNGGVIATLLDCHGAAAVMWAVAERGWTDSSGTPAPFVTASFEVTFHRPTPLGTPVRLTASPQSIDRSNMIIRSELAVDDKVRATMTATWTRFYPR